MIFSNATYSVDEDVGTIQLPLFLSNPSSFVEILQANVTDISTNGVVAT